MSFRYRRIVLASCCGLMGMVIGIGVTRLYYHSSLGKTDVFEDGKAYRWPGPSKAKEAITDDDGNGIPNKWVMSMWPREGLRIVAVLSDEENDDDEDVDSCTLSIVPAEASEDVFYLALHDTSGDGNFDTLNFGTRNAEAGPFCEYVDLNMDGFIDVFRDLKRKKQWISKENEWLKVLQVLELVPSERVVAFRDGSKVEFSFESPRWMETDVEQFDVEGESGPESQQ